jgi:polysaccharide biosynthesis/export protein
MFWRICAASFILVASLGTSARAAGEPPGKPAVDSQYRLQPGDELAVSVLPREEYGSTGTILPGGSLHLKIVGAVQAAGLTVPQLEERLHQEFLKVLKRPRVAVAVVKLGRPPQVTVSGAVTKGGALPHESGLRVSKALDLAGGPTPEADLTRVTVARGDLRRMVVNLADPASGADNTRNLLLEAGDSVFVPLVHRITVTVTGAVKTPGPVPDARPELRAHQAIGLAGGALAEADLRSVTINHADLTRTVIDLSTAERLADPAHNQVLRDGDAIHVELLFRPGVVWIGGEVTNPASYELKAGMTLDDLILAAGKVTLVADLERIELLRAGEPRRQINLTAAREQGASGRVALAPGDAINVPRRADVVNVIGAIEHPGARPLTAGQTIQQFFTEGQPETLAALDDARVDLKGVQLIRRGEATRQVDLRAVLKNAKHKQNYELKSGDVLFLPSRDRDKKKPGTADYLRALPFVGGLFGLL